MDVQNLTYLWVDNISYKTFNATDNAVICIDRGKCVTSVSSHCEVVSCIRFEYQPQFGIPSFWRV